MRISVFLLFLVLSRGISAQITFQEWYGASNGFDYSLSATAVSAGGYIVAVNTDSTPSASMDMMLLRTDANGNETWRRYFGTSGWDISTGVIETNDGGFALCGAWNGLGSDSAVVIKTDANGNQQWQSVFLPTPGRAVAQDLLQLSDGSIIVCGFTGASSTPDGFITKFNSSGIVVWQKVHGSPSMDEFLALEEVSGNGFILGGRTDSYSASADFWLVRTDANGDTLWTRGLGTAVTEYAYDVTCTQDGGFAIFGEEYMSGGDALLIKTNSSGVQQWLQTYDGGGWEFGRSLVETWDGGFALAGRKENPANSNHMWLIRADVNGTYLWDRTYPSSYMSEGADLHITSDGGFLIAGYDNSLSGDPGQAYLVKTESAGYVSVAESIVSVDFVFAQDVSNQTITITFGSAVPGRRVRIVDAEGRLVCDEIAYENVFTLSTSSLSRGVYVYSVYGEPVMLRSGKFLHL